MLRLVFFLISGLIAIIAVENNDTAAEFLCDRYTSLDYEEHNHDVTQWATCMSNIRYLVWFIYLPYLLF